MDVERPEPADPVTYERLLKADQEPGNWLMYSGTYNGWRFSRLNQITAQNVKNLRVKWLFQGRHIEKFETTPLVVDGIMYLTRPENAIYALDAVTGRQLWMYEHQKPGADVQLLRQGQPRAGDPRQHAVHEHARHARHRGRREIRPRAVEDRRCSITRRPAATPRPGAPLVVKDKVIVGMAGGERGVSGFLDAYDPKTGKRAVALQHHSAAGRAEFRDMGRRLVEDRRRRRPGTPAPTIPTRTRCSGAPAIRGRITTTTSAQATTCIPARCWRSIPTPAS